MNGRNEAAAPAILDHFITFETESGPNYGNINPQNIVQPLSWTGSDHQLHPRAENDEETPTYPNQDAEYDNAIHNISGIAGGFSNDTEHGVVFLRAQSAANINFDAQAFEPPTLDAGFNTSNESTPLMLQAIEQYPINQSHYHNMFDQEVYGRELQFPPFNINQQFVNDNSYPYDGFGPGDSSNMFSNPMILLQPSVWLDSNECFYFNPEINLGTVGSQFRLQGEQSGDSTLGLTYLQNELYGAEFSPTQQNQQPITLDISASSVRRSKKRNGNEEQNRHTHSTNAWMYMREHHIKRLVQANHTTEEMTIELDMIHDFQTS